MQRLQRLEEEALQLGHDLDEAAKQRATLAALLDDVRSMVQSHEARVSAAEHRELGLLRSNPCASAQQCSASAVSSSQLSRHLLSISTQLRNVLDDDGDAISDSCRGTPTLSDSLAGENDTLERATKALGVVVTQALDVWPADDSERLSPAEMPRSVTARNGMTPVVLEQLAEEQKRQFELKERLDAVQGANATFAEAFATRRSVLAADVDSADPAKDRVTWEQAKQHLWGDSDSDGPTTALRELASSLSSALNVPWPSMIGTLHNKAAAAEPCRQSDGSIVVGGGEDAGHSEAEMRERATALKSQIQEAFSAVCWALQQRAAVEFGHVLEHRLQNCATVSQLAKAETKLSASDDALEEELQSVRQDAQHVGRLAEQAKQRADSVGDQLDSMLGSEAVDKLMAGLDAAAGEISALRVELEQTVTRVEMRTALAAVAEARTAEESEGKSEELSSEIKRLARELRKKASAADLDALSHALEAQLAEEQPGLLVVRCLACNRPLKAGSDAHDPHASLYSTSTTPPVTLSRPGSGSLPRVRVPSDMLSGTHSGASPGRRRSRPRSSPAGLSRSASAAHARTKAEKAARVRSRDRESLSSSPHPRSGHAATPPSHAADEIDDREVAGTEEHGVAVPRRSEGGLVHVPEVQAEADVQGLGIDSAGDEDVRDRLARSADARHSSPSVGDPRHQTVKPATQQRARSSVRPQATRSRHPSHAVELPRMGGSASTSALLGPMMTNSASRLSTPDIGAEQRTPYARVMPGKIRRNVRSAQGTRY